MVPCIKIIEPIIVYSVVPNYLLLLLTHNYQLRKVSKLKFKPLLGFFYFNLYTNMQLNTKMNCTINATKKMVRYFLDKLKIQ